MAVVAMESACDRLVAAKKEPGKEKAKINLGGEDFLCVSKIEIEIILSYRLTGV